MLENLVKRIERHPEELKKLSKTLAKNLVKRIESTFNAKPVDLAGLVRESRKEN